MDRLRIGVIGLGWFGEIHCDAIIGTPSLELASLCTRTEGRLNELGKKYGVKKLHKDYKDMLADPDIDAVSITTMWDQHTDITIDALKAGKHVLLEKPFTVNAREAKEVIDAAKSMNVFIMEAMWTRFLPVQSAIQEVIKNGLIGRPRYIVAEHSQELTSKPRLWDPELGGGTLLDLGIYPLNFIVRILGVPSKVTAKAHLTTDKVDESLSAILEYPSDAMATFFSSMSATGPANASILGSTGRIDLDYRLLEQTTFRVYNNDAEIIHSYSEEILGTGRQYQAIEVERCINAGQNESPTMSHKDTIDILTLTDEMRSQVGVSYKNDRI